MDPNANHIIPVLPPVILLQKSSSSVQFPWELCVTDYQTLWTVYEFSGLFWFKYRLYEYEATELNL